MTKRLTHIGIDYGAKTSGTTAIAFCEKQTLHVLQSEKGSNADRFIDEFIDSHQLELVFIDAPLSLPAIYRGYPGKDFFYRQCDKDLQAMSPMFLGGLSARAMQLSNQYKEIQFLETYPKHLAKVLPLKHYKKQKKLKQINLTELKEHLPCMVDEKVNSWHKYDALLAWLSGQRYLTGIAQKYGEQEEGMIHI